MMSQYIRDLVVYTGPHKSTQRASAPKLQKDMLMYKLHDYNLSVDLKIRKASELSVEVLLLNVHIYATL